MSDMRTAEHAFVSTVKAAGDLLRGVEVLLNRHGLTAAQYNVLRILRGAGEAGACGKEIAANLITAEPDVTRLLDRMEKQGLISRRRGPRDRRFVTARITAAGLERVDALDGPVEELHLRRFAEFSEGEMEQLIFLMGKVLGG
jgi:DNA-binding MarR family transcriptional regulator